MSRLILVILRAFRWIFYKHAIKFGVEGVKYVPGRLVLERRSLVVILFWWVCLHFYFQPAAAPILHQVLWCMGFSRLCPLPFAM